MSAFLTGILFILEASFDLLLEAGVVEIKESNFIDFGSVKNSGSNNNARHWLLLPKFIIMYY